MRLAVELGIHLGLFLGARNQGLGGGAMKVVFGVFSGPKKKGKTIHRILGQQRGEKIKVYSY